MGFHQLLKEQARMCICGKLGHSWKFVLPLQIKDATREVLCGCATCEEQKWIQIPQEGWERFLKDVADGKVK